MAALENQRRIAIFLDFENLVTNTGITAANFDLKPSVDRLLEKGKVIYRRAYADWSRFKEAKGNLHELGVELIDVPPSTRSGKNGADMRLVIDALELCYARDFIDTFVIASGDSDFCPLAYKLRENDRHVIGIGVKESTSRLFVKACDEFVYLKPGTEAPARRPRRILRVSEAPQAPQVAAPEAPAKKPAASRRTAAGRKAAEAAEQAALEQASEQVSEQVSEEPAEPSKAARSSRPAAAPRASSGAAKSPARGTGRRAPKVPEVPPVARDVVSSLLAHATGPINPSLLKETIVRKEPDFDEREHGFSTFSKMLEAMEEEGLLKRQQIRGRQWYITPAEATVGPGWPSAEQAPLPFREPGGDDGDEEQARFDEAGDEEIPF